MHNSSDRTQCLDENRLSALFDGQLKDDERARLEAHLETCSDCRLLVAALARTSWAEGRDPLLAAHRSTASVEPGTVVGRYLVIERIGEGGQGVVYSAYDPELEREVALKLVRGQAHVDGRDHERLKREARAMAQLDHVNIVRVYDLGVSDGRLFVAMELVDGVSLHEWLRAEHSWRDIVAVFREAGAGLAAAHRQALVHGDFKLENVLVAASGRVRVADFGLAGAVELAADAGPAAAGDATAAATQTRGIRGTPRYMAPELWRGEAASTASDQFAFCVALHEALYGVPPFAGATMGEIASAIKAGVRTAPLKAASVPSRVEAIVARGLSADPHAR
ncbi:MAG TPA: protein kinase, partial [Polyangia bacterium]|nr:protein kinase [Polyangia bacterium]